MYAKENRNSNRHCLEERDDFHPNDKTMSLDLILYLLIIILELAYGVQKGPKALDLNFIYKWLKV